MTERSIRGILSRRGAPIRRGIRIAYGPCKYSINCTKISRTLIDRTTDLLTGSQPANHLSSTLTRFHPTEQSHSIIQSAAKYWLTILLDLTSGVECAVEYPGHMISLLCRRLPEDFGPAMLPQQMAPVSIFTCNLNDDHVRGLDGENQKTMGLRAEQTGPRCTYRRFMEESKKGILSYTRRYPIRELLPVAQQVHVGVLRVRVYYGQVFGLIVRWRRGLFSLLHRQ